MENLVRPLWRAAGSGAEAPPLATRPITICPLNEVLPLINTLSLSQSLTCYDATEWATFVEQVGYTSSGGFFVNHIVFAGIACMYNCDLTIIQSMPDETPASRGNV